MERNLRNLAARAAPSASRAIYEDEDEDEYNPGGLSIAVPLSPGRAAHSSPGRAAHSSPGRAAHSSPGRVSRRGSPLRESPRAGPSVSLNSVPGAVEQEHIVRRVVSLISQITNNPNNNPEENLNRLRELLEDNTFLSTPSAGFIFNMRMYRLAELFISLNRRDLSLIVYEIIRKQHLIQSLLAEGISSEMINKVIYFLNFNDSHHNHERLITDAHELISNLSQLDPGSYGRKSQRKLKKRKSKGKLKRKSQKL